MKAIVNGKIVMPDRIVEDCALLYDTTIRGVVPTQELPEDVTRIDARGGYVMPGLIDLHVHGYAGVDVSDTDEEGLVRMSRALLKEGVTGFLATTMTRPVKELHRAWETCRTAMKRCPNLLGVHAEGPFVSAAKCGAQDPACAIPPDAAVVSGYADVIRLVTVAPEYPEAADAIRRMTEMGLVVSLGHTAADYATAMACIHAGATHATHLFNAMSPLTHREPGVVGAVLNEDVSCELIADNHHVHPALYETVWRVKKDDLCLVTDCLSAGGMPPGEYRLGGAPIVSDGQVCRLPDGTLAGSLLTLPRAIRNLQEQTRIPLWECVGCASLNPAFALGLRCKGSLEIGQDADIVIADNHLVVSATIMGGETLYQT